MGAPPGRAGSRAPPGAEAACDGGDRGWSAARAAEARAAPPSVPVGRALAPWYPPEARGLRLGPIPSVLALARLGCTVPVPRGRLAQLARAPDRHSGGHRFESCNAHHFILAGWDRTIHGMGTLPAVDSNLCPPRGRIAGYGPGGPPRWFESCNAHHLLPPPKARVERVAARRAGPAGAATACVRPYEHTSRKHVPHRRPAHRGPPQSPRTCAGRPPRQPPRTRQSLDRIRGPPRGK